jgi:hypothetical protein
VAVIGGALAGFFAGAVSSRQTLELNQVVYAAGTATNASTLGTAQLQTAPAGQTQAEQNEVQQATQQEVSRLKAENHQLQALVDELQKERPAAHNRRVKTHHHRRSPAHA